ncbi:Hypothetical predicted protein [Podarcis lilfordi]|uniref:Uncharacterized protein n=1 Tax=Podarcis lilfordi TaxID=74358 RepID=A0AA35K7L0_9SAUR|nr:Hypothetical predicted protein [Podarcis lilfordi]
MAGWRVKRGEPICYPRLLAFSTFPSLLIPPPFAFLTVAFHLWLSLPRAAHSARSVTFQFNTRCKAFRTWRIVNSAYRNPLKLCLLILMTWTWLSVVE